MAGPRAKASIKARGAAAVRTGLTADDVFQDMMDSYAKEKKGSPAKWAKGVELLPYLKPKLKSIDVTQTANVKVNISIGGDDADDNG